MTKLMILVDLYVELVINIDRTVVFKVLLWIISVCNLIGMNYEHPGPSRRAWKYIS
jgi:hypothetical protein